MRALWDQEDHQAKNYFRSIRAGAQRRHIDTYLPSSVTNEEKLSLEFIRTVCYLSRKINFILLCCKFDKKVYVVL